MLPTKINKIDAWLHQNTSKSSLKLPVLNSKKIRLIENSTFLTTSEKKELLLILLGYKFVGELKSINETKKIKLLKTLELKYFINSYMHSKKGKLKWLQISVNKKINQFIKKHSNSMSAFEVGLLYGYPSTAILAFQNLIPRQTTPSKNKLIDYWFGMVRSKQYYKDEQKYLENVLNIIKKASPKIYKELEYSKPNY